MRKRLNLLKFYADQDRRDSPNRPRPTIYRKSHQNPLKINDRRDSLWGGRESNLRQSGSLEWFHFSAGRCRAETARIDRGIIDYPVNRGQECTIVNIAFRP
jgi:hypothetical protein